jgi:hypothetical protein
MIGAQKLPKVLRKKNLNSNFNSAAIAMLMLHRKKAKLCEQYHKVHKSWQIYSDVK